LCLSLCLVNFLLHPSHRAPQDINPDSSMKAPEISGENLRAEEPLSPNAPKTDFKAPEPPSPSGTKSSPNPTKAPSPQKPSPSKTTPSLNPLETPLSPELAKSPKTTPPSPRSHGLGSIGEAPLGGGSTQHKPKNLPR
jgi:hypothetical protein